MSNGSFLNIQSSTALAKAVAGKDGIRINTVEENQMPYGRDGVITMGTPSIYNHQEYLEQLHSVIGQVAPQNEFFDNVSGDNERQEAHKQILRHHTCDKHMNGIYEGRDSLIASGYKKQATAINEKLAEIAQEDSTSAALLYLANECRNDWQDYNHLDVPDGLQPHIDKLSPLKDKMMSLETEDDLRELLKLIEEEEYDEQDSGGQGSGDSDEGGDQSGDDGDSDGSSDGSGDDGSEESSGSGEDGDGGDSSSEDGGGSEGDGEDGSGASDDGGAEGGQGGDSDGEGSGDSGTGEQGDSPGEAGGNPQVSEQRSPEEERQPVQSNKGDSGGALRDLGIYPDDAPEIPNEAPEGPYTPTNLLSNEYITDKHSIDEYMKDRILKEASRLKLSNKVAKYLKAMAQVRMQMGLKKGYLCNSKVYRSLTGPQPRMFKQKQASKITQDVSITLLIDASGSMGKGKYSMACASAIAMSRVLQRLKVPHEVISFTSGFGQIEGRDEGRQVVGRYFDRAIITNNIIKPVEELRVSRDSLAHRFSHRERTHGANADGESLMYALSRLATRPESRKMIIVVSDGSPAYIGGKGDDHQYLKDVIEKVEVQPNWDIFGIGIDDSSVERFYRRNRVLRDLRELEPLFLELIREKIVI